MTLPPINQDETFTERMLEEVQKGRLTVETLKKEIDALRKILPSSPKFSRKDTVEITREQWEHLLVLEKKNRLLEAELEQVMKKPKEERFGSVFWISVGAGAVMIAAFTWFELIIPFLKTLF